LSKEFLRSVPLRPGVYLMREGNGTVLYVGKARELRKRLASYLRVDVGEQSKTALLLAQVRSIDTILTGTEKEALILEASLIKQYRPRYNIILRDDKNYPLIKVTVQEAWPRLLMARSRQKDGARYFGPFSSAAAMWETIRLLNELFPLRRCKEKNLKVRTRPCLNAQMARCLAPCAGRVAREEYQALVRKVLLVLEGKNRELLLELGREMERAADELRFEEAALLRDRIRALQATLEKQQIVAAHGQDQDVFAFARQGAGVAVAVLAVRRGVVSGQQVFLLLDPVGRDAEVLAEVLSRYYGEEDRFLPREVLLPFAIAEAELLAEWLSERGGRRVAVLCPQRGEKARLLEMAEANAAQALADRERQDASWQALAAALGRTLRLARVPERIECLDISNISGQLAVGSLVCFLAGEPAKHLYRHYRIRTVHGPDDYAMMAEVLGRRLRRGKEENDLPDLLLVDGGRGQLAMAARAVRELDLAGRVELAAIAKEREGEGEKLYRPGRKNPILLPRHSPLLLYLMRLRDESHRYGVTFHRRLRGKRLLASPLQGIPGVGRERTRLLLKEFGSLARLQAAGQEELAAVAGIGATLAAQIRRHLHESGEAASEE
jgi:excinuclease ABC subunit C